MSTVRPANFPDHSPDYSNEGIIARAKKRRADAGWNRSQMLDAIWEETRENALLLYPRVAASLNPDHAQTMLAQLTDEVDKYAEWASLEETPDPAISDALVRFLDAIGIELVQEDGAAAHRAIASKPAQGEEWAAHIIYADMRNSRIAGTGTGGAALSPIQDAMRRLSMTLVATGALDHAANGGELPQVSGCFGRPQLRAIAKFLETIGREREEIVG